MSPVRRRVLFWVPIGLAVAGALVLAFRPEPVAVETAAVTRGPVVVAVDGEGVTRARELYVVSAPLTGRLLRVDLEVGDPVTGGETVVGRILPTAPSLLDVRTREERRAAVHAAEAALKLAAAERDRAAAEVEFARTEYARAQRLIAQEAVSPAALDRARLDLRTAEAALARAEAEQEVRRFELENARAQLMAPADEPADAEACCVVVRAPVDGAVLAVVQESESVVAAGAALVEIGDPRDLEVVVDVLSRDAVRLAPGARAIFENWGGEGALPGRVRYIEPTAFTEISALGIEEQRVNVIVDFTGPPARWARLGHGFRLDARLVVSAAADVARVPVTALVRAEGGGWQVYRVIDGRARTAAVELGRRNAELAEIRSGLAPGDVVVRFPSVRVADGVRVRPRAF
jgi:HlyD family secretion protein